MWEDRENDFKQEKTHRQSVDCASSCPAHGRIEFKMMSLGTPSLRQPLSGAEVCHQNSVFKSLPSQISHGFGNLLTWSHHT